MKTTEPPTGIIRTLPAIYGDKREQACRNYRNCVAAMERGEEGEYWYLALPSKPKQELLHVYIAIGGKIDARFTLAGYRDGGEATLWDGERRNVKIFAICVGPVERPPREIKQRGFQGFRYVTQPLW
jgi:hypothetical protein